jgi:hypothetical protein
MAGHCLNWIHCQSHACICRCDVCQPHMATRIAITLYVDVPEGMNETEVENWVCRHFPAKRPCYVRRSARDLAAARQYPEVMRARRF